MPTVRRNLKADPLRSLNAIQPLIVGKFNRLIVYDCCRHWFVLFCAQRRKGAKIAKEIQVKETVKN